MSATRHLFYLLDEDKNPVKATLTEWATWFENSPNRIIKQSRLLDKKVFISTIFLGLDHAWQGPPILFETMVFVDGEEDRQWRYASWVEAICHHNEILSKWAATLNQHEAAIGELINQATGIDLPND